MNDLTLPDTAAANSQHIFPYTTDCVFFATYDFPDNAVVYLFT